MVSTQLVQAGRHSLLGHTPWFCMVFGYFVQKLFTISSLMIRNLNRNPGGLLIQHIAPNREVKPRISR